MIQREKNQMKMVRNNKGMSLVEVIVAITILSLVIVPVLQAMTMATAYNAKARVRQNLTLTAESIMETFKGYDLESLVGIFGEGGSGISGIDGSYSVNTQENGGYEFSISDFEEDSRLYSASIILTPKVTSDVFTIDNVDSSKDALFMADATNDRDLNSKIENEFKSNDNDYTALYDELTDNGRNKVYSEGKALINSAQVLKSSVSISSYIELYNRELTFDIVKVGDAYRVNVDMVYHYYIKDFPYYTGNLESESESEDLDELQYMTYPQGEDAYFSYKQSLDIDKDYTELERLYIFYYPQYDLPQGNDKIVINNTANVNNFSCYILKQKNNDLNDTRLSQYEQKYKPIVVCNNTQPLFYLYHNFDTNIASEDGTTPSGLVSGNYTNKDDASLTDSSLLFSNESISYDIKVEITYNGESVVNLESTKNEHIKSEDTNTEGESGE
jgi:prepilin-type N-terminal cleavage/methylation domain-containing protein